MKAPVPFLVYLQALGGKFLGPNAYNNSGIQVSLKYSLGIFPVEYKVISGTDDGAINTTFTNGSTSFMPILTMPESGTGNPAVNYLTAGPHTIVGKTNIFLPGSNETATLIVHIPTPSGKLIEIQEPVLLNPQQTDYRIIVVVPGLLLTENTSVLIPPDTISVFVNMMCGCKVTTGLSTSFWTWTDFEVFARIIYNDGVNEDVTLTFDKAANQSLFTGKVPDINRVNKINFTARQKSTGNYGALLQSFIK
ncbi:MAG: hypothetical protein JNM88_07720 [Chitinophagaceae bacterium]|nr:hypothetical protein [Chitinophagaceae bacterium]